MNEFLHAAVEHEFMRNALIAGALAGVAGGVVGTYVVVRRINYIAGGIAHCVLGGMGAAVYLSRARGWEWLQPLHGALAAALLAALIIGWVSLRARQREDTVIGALWAVGMAVGVFFIAKTPGFGADLMSYLFGNILMTTKTDLWMMVALDVVVVASGVLFYNQFLGVCFDEEFVRVRGLNSHFYYLLLLCLTALTVVLLAAVVGVVMVIAMLTLPVAAAANFSKSLWKIMLLSMVFNAAFTTGGLALSYGPDLPAGATIVLLAGAAYLVVVVFGKALKPKRV